MDFLHLSGQHRAPLTALQADYKRSTGEEAPTFQDMESLFCAIEEKRVFFYGCMGEGKLIACCSVAPTFTTFDYKTGGVFEDFYIVPAYRHTGLARQPVQYAYRESGVSSLTVGCADCDIAMYRALGFTLRLGNLLAYA